MQCGILKDGPAATMDSMHRRTPELHFRLATAEDMPALRALVEASVRQLQAVDYTAGEIEGALDGLLGLDSQLIADGTYFIAMAAPTDGEAVLAGCGGWSRRKTLFGSDRATLRDDAFLDPATDAAKIRAIFVHPEWAGCGIGSRILEQCERAALGAGFSTLEMGSTLTGAPFYARRGYREIERMRMPLPNGERYSIVRMRKRSLPGTER